MSEVREARRSRSAGRSFTTFMASNRGRSVRFGLGAVLIGTGVFTGSPAGYVIAVFGLLPIASGAFNLCPVAPLWGGHFLGATYCGRPARMEDDGVIAQRPPG